MKPISDRWIEKARKEAVYPPYKKALKELQRVREAVREHQSDLIWASAPLGHGANEALYAATLPEAQPKRKGRG